MHERTSRERYIAPGSDVPARGNLTNRLVKNPVYEDYRKDLILEGIYGGQGRNPIQRTNH